MAAGLAARGIFVGPYLCQKIKRLHHEVLRIVKLKPGYVVDHINYDTLDNCKANLRIITSHQNTTRQRPRSNKKSSKYRGVCYKLKSAKGPAGFLAKVTCKGKHHYLDIFKTEREAVEAYNKKAAELYGEFSYQNEWTGPTDREKLAKIKTRFPAINAGRAVSANSA